MNFKLFFLFYLLVGCGVEGPPIPPSHTTLPLPFEEVLMDKDQSEEKKSEIQNRDDE